MSFRLITVLWALAAVPVMLWFFLARERGRTELARRFVAERLRGVTNPSRSLRPWLLAAAIAGAIVALAGPHAGYAIVPITARESNRVIVVDVSNSMDATDVGTARLSAAKAIGKRLIEAQPGRVALLVFEGVPEVVAPMTSDTDAVTALLDSLQSGETGQAGSDLGSAVLAALRLIQADPNQKADIVLISDGEDQGSRAKEASSRARSAGVPVSTILLGTAQGGTIPTARGMLRDSGGNVVTTYARPQVMNELAEATGGVALQNPFSEQALDRLLVASRGTDQERQTRVPVDRYQWPLAAALLLFTAASVANRGAD